MPSSDTERLVTLRPPEALWNRFFTLSPLVVVGTREEGGGYTFAPKHLAMPMGWQHYFGFVCTPSHRTYQNIKAAGSFTVSYPRPDQVEAVAALAAPRDAQGQRPAAQEAATFPAEEIDGAFFGGGYLFVECHLERFVDRLGKNSLILGSVAAVHVDEAALRPPAQEQEGAPAQEGAPGDDAARLQQVPLLAYLDPGRYAVVRESEAFPFPQDFDRRKAYPTEAGFGDFGK